MGANPQKVRTMCCRTNGNFLEHWEIGPMERWTYDMALAFTWWHWSHLGSTLAYTLASLLQEKWSLWNILNWIRPCLIQIDDAFIRLIASCQVTGICSLPGICRLRSSSHLVFIWWREGAATFWIISYTNETKPFVCGSLLTQSWIQSSSMAIREAEMHVFV